MDLPKAKTTRTQKKKINLDVKLSKFDMDLLKAKTTRTQNKKMNLDVKLSKFDMDLPKAKTTKTQKKKMNSGVKLSKCDMDLPKAKTTKTQNPTTFKKMIEKARKPKLTLLDKKEILRLVDSGESKKVIAKQYTITSPSISYIIRIRDNIEQALNKENCPKKAKYIRNDNHGGTNTAMWMWFKEFREANPQLPLSVKLIKSKALNFHEILCGKDDFSASSGWYEKWSANYNIPSLKKTGEKSTAPANEMTYFKQHLSCVLEQEEIQLAQLYNFEETALQYRSIPSRTLESFLEKNDTSFKSIKDRITISPCYNATGNHKLKLQVIDKAKQSRCFANGFPQEVTYMASNKAWQTKELFVQWFYEAFIPQVKEYQEERGLNGKAILLLENCASHADLVLTSENGLIRTMFLPPQNPIQQPCDQNVILSLKKNYRKLLLQEMSTVGSNEPQMFLQTWNIKQCVRLLTQAWYELSPKVLLKSWKKVLGTYEPYLKYFSQIDNENEQDEDCDWLYNEVDWEQQNFEEESALCSTDDEIIQQVKGVEDDPEENNIFIDGSSFFSVDDQEEEGNDSSVMDPLNNNESKKEHIKALQLLTGLEQYYQFQEDGGPNEATILSLKSEIMDKINKM